MITKAYHTTPKVVSYCKLTWKKELKTYKWNELINKRKFVRCRGWCTCFVQNHKSILQCVLFLIFIISALSVILWIFVEISTEDNVIWKVAQQLYKMQTPNGLPDIIAHAAKWIVCRCLITDTRKDTSISNKETRISVSNNLRILHLLFRKVNKFLIIATFSTIKLNYIFEMNALQFIKYQIKWTDRKCKNNFFPIKNCNGWWPWYFINVATFVVAE